MATQLGDQYRRVEDQVNERLREILTDPNQSRLRRRLEGVLDEIQRRQRDLEGEARRWLQANLPAAYVQGAEATGLGFEFTQVHAQAMGRLVSDTYADVLKSTRHMTRDVKAMIRATGKDVLVEKVARGTPVKTAAVQLRRQMLDQGVTAVTYRDGRKIRVSTYAEMLARTKTATAYNIGGVNQARVHGINYFEIVDGGDCGLITHDDGRKANGLIVPGEVAGAFPISHPNCRRDFIARPDVEGLDDAQNAELFGDAAERGDQAALNELMAQAPAGGMDAVRRYLVATAQPATPAGRQPRTERTARTERSPRTPRS